LREEEEHVVLLNKKIHILVSQVYCVWKVVKSPTIISNNLVFCCKTTWAFVGWHRIAGNTCS